MVQAHPLGNPPERQLWKESSFLGLLVKVAWGVFQRCVETTLDMGAPIHGRKSMDFTGIFLFIPYKLSLNNSISFTGDFVPTL